MPTSLGDTFLAAPLYQQGYAKGFGTLFTAVYDPRAGGLALRWPREDWIQGLDRFAEGRREICYDPATASALEHVDDSIQAMVAAMARFLLPEIATDLEGWRARASDGEVGWTDFGKVFAGAYATDAANKQTYQLGCGCAYGGRIRLC